MKRFLDIVMPMKTAACYCYCGTLCYYMAVAFFLGWEGISLPKLFSLLLVSVAAGVLQVLAFSDLVIKKLAYGWRLVVFVVPFFAVLTAFALGFGWFPSEEKGAWVLFAVIFLSIFLIACVGFEIYFRLSGKKYDGLLGQYRKAKDGQTQ